jgi:predicted transcriptional regulator
MEISLKKIITGEKLIQDFERIYSSLDDLEKLYEKNPDNMKMYTDLDDWKYYQNHPDKVIEETKDIITEKLILGNLEIDLLKLIKYKKPKSIRELAKIHNKDIKIVKSKLTELEKEGLIQLKKSPKRGITPIFNYDKIEINF